MIITKDDKEKILRNANQFFREDSDVLKKIKRIYNDKDTVVIERIPNGYLINKIEFIGKEAIIGWVGHNIRKYI